MIEDVASLLLPYGSDDWSDAAHHDYQFEIQQVVAALSEELQAEFGRWVRQLHIPVADSILSKLLPIDQNQVFLNFNYTPSLQRIYGVRDSRITYIHGSSTKPNDRLILGHGWQRKPEDSLLYGRDIEETDIRELQGNQLLDQYFEATFKPTAKIIRENLPFFCTLRSVDEVWVMGHSLESVDLPYFHEITRHIDVGRTHWKVSYYRDDSRIRSNFDQLELPNANVTFALLEQF